MNYYTAEMARKDVSDYNIISGSDYHKEQLLSILDSIKQKANEGKTELIWKVYFDDGKLIDWSEGQIPFYLDYIMESLFKLGYTSTVEAGCLCVRWG
jgi:hypothetical protein